MSGAPERDHEIHVRIGVLHLDDLEERSVTDGDVRAELKNATAHCGPGDIVQDARRSLRRQARDQQFRQTSVV